MLNGENKLCAIKAKNECSNSKSPKKCFTSKFKACISDKNENDNDVNAEVEEAEANAEVEEVEAEAMVEEVESEAEVLDLEGGDTKKVCEIEAKKECIDAKDQEKCFVEKMKWCMSGKKEEE